MHSLTRMYDGVYGGLYIHQYYTLSHIIFSFLACMIVLVDVLGNISPNDQTNPRNPVLQNFPTDLPAYVFASVFIYSVK